MRVGAQCNHVHTYRCRRRIIQAMAVDHPRIQSLVEHIVDLSGVPDPSDDMPGPLEAEDEPDGELLGESDDESSEDGGMGDAEKEDLDGEHMAMALEEEQRRRA